MPMISVKSIKSKRGRHLQEGQDERILTLLEEAEHTCLLKLIDNHHSPTFTLDEIGQALSITRERVRQIELKALDAIKEAANPEDFERPEPAQQWAFASS